MIWYGNISISIEFKLLIMKQTWF